MDIKQHGNVIVAYHELNARLKPYGLEIHAWGRLAIRHITDPYSNWVVNNIDSIEEIECFVQGLEYSQPELKLKNN